LIEGGCVNESRAALHGSSVHVLAMSDLEDGDVAILVVDGIDDSIMALSHSIAVIVSRQFLSAMRTGLFCEVANLRDDPGAIRLGANSLQLLPSGRLDEEAI
jgi:hypothetical protein